MSENEDLEIAEILRQAFAEQSSDDFSTMEQALLDLERDPDNEESLRAVFRVCHTLKGDSRSLGFEELAAVAHRLEDLLTALRAGSLTMAPALMGLLLDSLDVARSMADDALAGTRDHAADGEFLLERLQACLDLGAAEQGGLGSSSSDAGDSIEASKGVERSKTLRVKVELLDRLLNLAGEIAIGRGGFASKLVGDSEGSPAALLEAHQELDPLVDELQEAVMALRLVPIGPLFQQQKRLIRDVSAALGKEARLLVEGDGAELDTTIVDHLRDPLGHMIRNAIAHGIETPEERERSGKRREGEIRLSAVREGSMILVEVCDDGCGLDIERLRRRAVATGLIQDGASHSDDEIAELIFASGFSIESETNLIAGRGVGMDVVRRNVEDIGGTVRVSSLLGHGTTFRIELPLTVAIVEALGIGVGGEQYVIPMSFVVECVQLPEAYQEGAVGGVLELRGKPLPFVRLRHVLDTPGPSPTREHVVVIDQRGERAGIAVDTLFGECQAVVKPLDPLFREVAGIAGTTIRSDGHVALILDAPLLLREAVGWRPSTDARVDTVRAANSSAIAV